LPIINGIRMKRFVVRTLLVLLVALVSYAVHIGIKATQLNSSYNAGIVALKNGDDEAAIKYLSRALEIHPRHAEAYDARGCAWRRKGEYAAAISDHGESIRLSSKNGATYYNRGLAFNENGAHAAAIDDFNTAIRLGFREWMVYAERGLAWSNLDGDELPGQDHDELALQDFDEAIGLSSIEPVCYFRRGWLRDRQGMFHSAIADFTTAIILDYQLEIAYFKRGVAYHRVHEYAAAERDFSDAIRLNPDDWMSRCSLAFQLASCPDEKFRDGKRAVDLAQRACELSGEKSLPCVIVLAAAHAEAGDWDLAITRQNEAIDMETRANSVTTALKLQLSEMLLKYQRREPYREGDIPSVHEFWGTKQDELY
jgi:tetratricopeptide (TPR) repeat protein